MRPGDRPPQTVQTYSAAGVPNLHIYPTPSQTVFWPVTPELTRPHFSFPARGLVLRPTVRPIFRPIFRLNAPPELASARTHRPPPSPAVQPILSR